MKTLILNGSPRKNGDTAFLLSELKKYLDGEVVELWVSEANKDIELSSCLDCRTCTKTGTCFIKDDMDIIYKEDYDNIIVASPIYISSLPSKLVALASRFQAYYAYQNLNDGVKEHSKKRAALILVGGGNGKPDHAIKLAKWIFRNVGASYSDEAFVGSLMTDQVKAKDDENAINGVRALAAYLNNSISLDEASKQKSLGK